MLRLYFTVYPSSRHNTDTVQYDLHSSSPSPMKWKCAAPTRRALAWHSSILPIWLGGGSRLAGETEYYRLSGYPAYCILRVLWGRHSTTAPRATHCRVLQVQYLGVQSTGGTGPHVFRVLQVQDLGGIAYCKYSNMWLHKTVGP